MPVQRMSVKGAVNLLFPVRFEGIRGNVVVVLVSLLRYVVWKVLQYLKVLNISCMKEQLVVTL
jgi:hypothetical protein